MCRVVSDRGMVYVRYTLEGFPMQDPKVMFCLVALCLVVRADWDIIDAARLDSISSNVNSINTSMTNNFYSSFERFNNVSEMGSDGYGVLNPWLFQMAYGVELKPRHVGGSNEHWNLNPNVPTDDYLPAFGLKAGYEDNTQNYLDYIRAFNSQKNYYSNGYLDNDNIPIDNWLSMSYGMDILNTLDSANFNRVGLEEKTQSVMIGDQVSSAFFEADNFSKNVRYRLCAIADRSIGDYSGDLLEFRFDWLHEFLSKCCSLISNNTWTFYAPWMLSKSYTFTLRPVEGNYLYPLYSAWNSKRVYLDPFLLFVCYSAVFGFVLSRVYAILTK